LLKAPPDVTNALALTTASGGIGAGLRVVAQSDQHDGVQGAVELAVTGTIQPVADL
jgi:hypothetical protein